MQAAAQVWSSVGLVTRGPADAGDLAYPRPVENARQVHRDGIVSLADGRSGSTTVGNINEAHQP